MDCRCPLQYGNRLFGDHQPAKLPKLVQVAEGLNANRLINTAYVHRLPVVVLSGRDTDVQNEPMREHSRANLLRRPLQACANGQIAESVNPGGTATGTDIQVDLRLQDFTRKPAAKELALADVHDMSGRAECGEVTEARYRAPLRILGLIRMVLVREFLQKLPRGRKAVLEVR